VRADPRPEYEGTLAWALLVDGPAALAADKARARELVASALRDPQCDRALFAAALLARGDGDLQKAEALLRRALALNGTFVEAERELRQVEARRPRPPQRRS
jgi:hypothetical protein